MLAFIKIRCSVPAINLIRKSIPFFSHFQLMQAQAPDVGRSFSPTRRNVCGGRISGRKKQNWADFLEKCHIRAVCKVKIPIAGHFWSGKIWPISADLEGQFFSGYRCRPGPLITVYRIVFGRRTVENNLNRNRPFLGAPDPPAPFEATLHRCVVWCCSSKGHPLI